MKKPKMYEAINKSYNSSENIGYDLFKNTFQLQENPVVKSSGWFGSDFAVNSSSELKSKHMIGTC